MRNIPREIIQHFFLSAKLLDENNREMIPCKTCTQNEKRIITIRVAERVHNDLRLQIAIGCSGKISSFFTFPYITGMPTDVNRRLHIQFSLFEFNDNMKIPGKEIRTQQTTTFRIYHHRRKRARESCTFLLFIYSFSPFT